MKSWIKMVVGGRCEDFWNSNFFAKKRGNLEKIEKSVAVGWAEAI